MDIDFTQSARKHRISKGRALEVIHAHEPTVEFRNGKKFFSWVGVDRRGLEIELIAIELNENLVVIHAMPTNFRRGK